MTPTSPAERSTFVGHAGLAFGIFHRYVYQPFKVGALRDSGRDKAALANAAAAAQAAAREIGLAKLGAGASTALRAMFAPLAALMPTLHGLASSLNHGHDDAADIKAAYGSIASIEKIGAASGLKITESSPATNAAR